MLTDHDKQATGKRERANEMNKEDPTQGIPVWLQPFTVNLEDLEAHVLAQLPLKERTLIGRSCFNSGDTKTEHSVHAYIRKNQKRSILRTEKYGDLITAEPKVLNEGREFRNNHRYKFSPISGIRVKPEHHRRRRKIDESASSPRSSQKVFIRTNYQNLASILHFIDQRQAELA